MNSPSHAIARWKLAPQTRARLIQVFFGGFALLVLALILDRARSVDWPTVGDALRAYGTTTLLITVLFALSAHAVASCYDLLGRRYVGHDLPATRVFSINAIAFAFSLNLGALVGGWAFRARLYTRFGLAGRTVLKVIAFAVLTNWSGFVLIAGLALAFWPPPLPASFQVDPAWLRAIGMLLLLLVVAYLGLCHFGSRRGAQMRVRGVVMTVPTLRMALLQLSLSSMHWLLAVAALHQLLPDDIPFARVVGVLFASSIAGAALHVPGSLGVLEGSIVQLLVDDLDVTQSLAAALTFRAAYYFLPFVIAATAYTVLEFKARRR